jgi:hypothetical protein
MPSYLRLLAYSRFIKNKGIGHLAFFRGCRKGD